MLVIELASLGFIKVIKIGEQINLLLVLEPKTTDAFFYSTKKEKRKKRKKN